MATVEEIQERHDVVVDIEKKLLELQQVILADCAFPFSSWSKSQNFRELCCNLEFVKCLSFLFRFLRSDVLSSLIINNGRSLVQNQDFNQTSSDFTCSCS